MKARYPICLLESTRRYCSRRSRNDLRIVSNHLKYKNCILIYLYCYCIVYLLRCLFISLLHACSMGDYFLYIYILFLFLTSTSIFYDSGSRLSIIWLFTVQRYGGSVRYQTPGMPYSAKTFPERLPQMLHIWVFQKTFYRIVWCSDFWNLHFLMHVKRLYDDEMTE